MKVTILKGISELDILMETRKGVAISYPYVTVSSGGTLRCKLFPADKVSDTLKKKLDKY